MGPRGNGGGRSSFEGSRKKEREHLRMTVMVCRGEMN
jgi:hypothetical protein